MPERRPERPLTPDGFAALVPVSRETLERLGLYLSLLRRWQAAINLVAASTLTDPWRRHVLDSGQLMRFVPAGTRRLIDLGSGAGLPGLVLAIMGVQDVHLIESDRRKAAFLREAARATGTRVTVHATRIEAAPMLEADAVTARALAPLPALLDHAYRFATPATCLLFPKGRQVEAELTEAAAGWTMKLVREASLSDPEGQIVIISGLRRAGSD